MSFAQFFIIPVFISFQAFFLMLLGPYVAHVPGNNGILGPGLITWIAFQAWAMFFLCGCSVKMALKTIAGYIGGIVASIAIFQLGNLLAQPLGGYWGYAIAVFIIVASANSINLTDGLDGLAGIIAATAFTAYGIIALLQEQDFLITFSFVVVGACFAFLWYNAHPAQMFMGDVGSQALGGALGVVALLTNQWLILPMIALVPVATTLSTIIQVGSAVLSRRFLGRDIRPFKMAPLHNHFVIIGWSETQIVQRWWLLGILGAMVGIALALI